MEKRLDFYATNIETSVHMETLSLVVETDDAEIILSEFSPQEIIDGYDDLEELYKLLKEKFEVV